MFLPYQPKKELKYSLACASLNVVLVKKGLSQYLVPSRMYGMLASARPVVVAIDKNSQDYDIIEEARCGFLIEPGDLQGLKKSILSVYKNRDLIGQMGSKGRSFAEERFSRNMATKAYQDLIDEMAQRNG